MRPHFHSWTRWQIRRLFVKGLPPARHRALLRELRSCPECDAVFREFHELESRLCVTREVPSPLAAERMASVVFGMLRSMSPDAPRERGRQWFPVSVAALTCAAALLAALVYSQFPSTRLADDRADHLVARGKRPMPDADVGFRILRIAETMDPVDDGQPLCLADLVTFTYTNLRPELRYLALFGIQEDGIIRWYYPGYEGERSIPIRTGALDEPLGDGIRLSKRHNSGWLRVSAVFLSQPIEKAVIEEAVRVHFLQPRAQRRFDPVQLGVEGAIEYSIRVDLVKSDVGADGGA